MTVQRWDWDPRVSVTISPGFLSIASLDSIRIDQTPMKKNNASDLRPTTAVRYVIAMLSLCYAVPVQGMAGKLTLSDFYCSFRVTFSPRLHPSRSSVVH